MRVTPFSCGTGVPLDTTVIAASVFSEKVATRFRLPVSGGTTIRTSTGSACSFITPVTFWPRPGFLLVRNWKASTGPCPRPPMQPARVPKTTNPTRIPMSSFFTTSSLLCPLSMYRQETFRHFFF